MEKKFEEYCQIKKECIGLGECIELSSEIFGLKKEEEVLSLKRQLNISIESMKRICEKCPNYVDG